MPHRRGHLHALQRDAAEFVAPEVEKRSIVTIYTTLTSSGWTGGDLTTLPPSSTPTEGNQETKATSADGQLDGAKGINKNIAEQTSSSLPTAIEASTAITATDMGGGLVAATPVPSTSSSSASSTFASSTTPAAASSATSAAPTSTSSSSSSGSIDVALKAGIALGVLGGLFVILSLVYFLIMRRKKQVEAEQRADDEKLHGNGGSNERPLTSGTSAKAPRLSLRPVTGLFTGFNGASHGDQTTRSINSAPKRAPGNSAWEHSSDGSSTSDQNPFGNHAQVLEEPGTPKYAMNHMTPISETSTQGPSPEHGINSVLTSAPRASAMTADTGSAARGVSAITMNSATIPAFLTTKDLPRSPPRSVEVSPIESMEGGPASSSNLAVVDRAERRQSVRNDKIPAPLDLTLPPKMPSASPPSPSGTEFSFSEVDPAQSPLPPSQGAAAIAEAGGPANTAVHRVQLDFVPTLDDELPLKAGGVVRLLHEYDDGWCLCIRLDRSAQGVVPRSCLSARPVKPRAHPPGRPRGPSAGQRGPGPSMQAFGPGIASAPRPQSPSGPAYRPAYQGRPHESGQPLSSQSHLPGQAY